MEHFLNAWNIAVFLSFLRAYGNIPFYLNSFSRHLSSSQTSISQLLLEKSEIEVREIAVRGESPLTNFFWGNYVVLLSLVSRTQTRKKIITEAN